MSYARAFKTAVIAHYFRHFYYNYITSTPGSMASELNAKLNERIRDFLLKTIFSKLRKYWQCKMHLLRIFSYLKMVSPLKVESLLNIIAEKGANHLFTKKFFCIPSAFTGDFSYMHQT